MSVLKYIFEPGSVAVIGASATTGTVGNAIFSNILQSNFQGAVYPVNPKNRQIMSVRAYSDVIKIPDTIDLAIICVPVAAIENVIWQCVEKGIRGLVVITAGFKEIGAEGRIQEEKISKLARDHSI